LHNSNNKGAISLVFLSLSHRACQKDVFCPFPNVIVVAT
jgi:hypothetical protein